jgi:hypothetical protein
MNSAECKSDFLASSATKKRKFSEDIDTNKKIKIQNNIKFKVDKSVSYVAVKNILITKPIGDAIKKKNSKVSLKGMKMQPGFQGFPLSRMNVVEEGIEKDIIFSPIKLERYKSTNYFIIIDGRHRFSWSMILGDTFIPCFIC